MLLYKNPTTMRNRVNIIIKSKNDIVPPSLVKGVEVPMIKFVLEAIPVQFIF
jgi:hypothetical protein